MAWSPLDAFRESRQSGMEYEQNLNLGPITLAWSSLHTLRESRKKRNGIQTNNLNLGSIALAWSPLHTLREFRNNQMEYEQNMNLGSITLARSPLDTLRESRKNGIRTKSEFGIHYFGMELFGYIERIQKKNEMEHEQNLNLGSITLAWSSLDTLRQSTKKTKWNTNKI